MTIIRGIGASDGIAIGRISLSAEDSTEVAKTKITDIRAETERAAAARRKAESCLNALYLDARKRVGEAESAIFQIHVMMLQDEDYIDSIDSIIANESANAEYAVWKTGKKFYEMFDQMEDSYMHARCSDVTDITKLLLRCLNPALARDWKSLAHKAVIAAVDLMPSETVQMDPTKVLAIVTQKGSKSSHSAILARTMGIPSVVGLKEEFAALREGMDVIVDGFTGQVILEPDEQSVLAYSGKRKEYLKHRENLKMLWGTQSVSKDGIELKINANIGSPADVDLAVTNDADGIGLFRSEFLYMEHGRFPTEDEQFAAYKTVLQKMNGKRVVIRTLDLGADKKVSYLDFKQEENPAMGCRAIRICLNRKEIFITQLRALLRASVYGHLAILFPMITSVQEVLEIKKIVRQVKADLISENLPIAENIELGIMIETPAAALLSDLLAPMVDFFSIGTNDLTQFALAADRMNPEVSGIFDPRHPAVLRMIRMTVENAKKSGIPVGICGDSAADRTLIPFYLAIGISELSVPPSAVLELRKAVQQTKLPQDRNPIVQQLCGYADALPHDGCKF
jgi:phosphotransferase system enzyme I (PtsI)